jgi:nucleoside-diphosphate-sugar epimerase
MTIRTLVVGSNGFIGHALVQGLSRQQDFRVRGAARGPTPQGLDLNGGHYVLPSNPMTLENAAFDQLFRDIDLVYFLAAATPRQLQNMSETERGKALNDNSAMPLHFATAAKSRAVKHFVFMSSCGVHGETSKGVPFTEQSPYEAHDAYVASKIAAERALLAAGTKIPDLTIIRPPTVYGPGFSGAVRHLLRCVKFGIPLPLAKLKNNKRKMMGLSNLVDFLLHVGRSPKAINQIFLVADNEELSTAAFLRFAGEASGKKAILLPVPLRPVEVAAALVGKSSMLARLFGDYQIDDSKCRELLNWTAPMSVLQELQNIYGTVRT